MKLNLNGKAGMADIGWEGDKVIITVEGFNGEAAANLELTASQAAELIKQLANGLTAIIKD